MYFNVYLFILREKQREREREGGCPSMHEQGGPEGGRENPKQAPHCQLRADAGLDPMK